MVAIDMDRSERILLDSARQRRVSKCSRQRRHSVHKTNCAVVRRTMEWWSFSLDETMNMVDKHTTTHTRRMERRHWVRRLSETTNWDNKVRRRLPVSEENDRQLYCATQLRTNTIDRTMLTKMKKGNAQNNVEREPRHKQSQNSPKTTEQLPRFANNISLSRHRKT